MKFLGSKPLFSTSLNNNKADAVSPSRNANVSLKVFNARGQLVRTLVDNLDQSTGVYAETWDGRDNAGNAMSSGIYFYRLSTAGRQLTRKMLLLK